MILHILFYKEVRIQGCNTGKKKTLYKKKDGKVKIYMQVEKQAKTRKVPYVTRNKGIINACSKKDLGTSKQDLQTQFRSISTPLQFQFQ